MEPRVEQFIRDFYKNELNKTISDVEVANLVKTYGNRYNALITDAYKVNNINLDDNKRKVIKDSYGLIERTPIKDYVFNLESEKNDKNGRNGYLSFNSSGGGSGAVGGYQVRFKTHKPEIDAVFGRDVARDEFYNSPTMQEKYMDYLLSSKYLPKLDSARAINKQRQLGLTDAELIYTMHHEGVEGALDFLKTGKSQFGSEETLKNQYKRGRESGLDPGAITFNPKDETVDIDVVKKMVDQEVDRSNIDVRLDDLRKLMKDSDRKAEAYSGVVTKLSGDQGKLSLRIAVANDYIKKHIGFENITPEQYQEIIGKEYQEKMENIAQNLEQKIKEDLKSVDYIEQNPLAGATRDLFSLEEDLYMDPEGISILPGNFGIDRSSEKRYSQKEIMEMETHPNPEHFNNQIEADDYLRKVKAHISKPDMMRFESKGYTYSDYLKASEQAFNEEHSKLIMDVGYNTYETYTNLLEKTEQDPEYKPNQKEIEAYNAVSSSPHFEKHRAIAEQMDRAYHKLEDLSSEHKMAVKYAEYEESLKDRYSKEMKDRGAAMNSLYKFGKFFKELPSYLQQSAAASVNLNIGTPIESMFGVDIGASQSIVSQSFSPKSLKTTRQEADFISYRYKVEIPYTDEEGNQSTNNYDVEIGKDGKPTGKIYDEEGFLVTTLTQNEVEHITKSLEKEDDLYEASSTIITRQSAGSQASDSFRDIIGMTLQAAAMRKGFKGASGLSRRIASPKSGIARSLKKGTENSLAKMAESSRTLSVLGSMSQYSGLMAVTAAREGRVTDPFDLFIVGNTLAAQESISEAIFPFVGRLSQGRRLINPNTPFGKIFGKAKFNSKDYRTLINSVKKGGVLNYTLKGFADLAAASISEGLEEVFVELTDRHVKGFLNNALDLSFDPHVPEFEDYATAFAVGAIAGSGFGSIGTLNTITKRNSLQKDIYTTALKNAIKEPLLFNKFVDADTNLTQEEKDRIKKVYDRTRQISSHIFDSSDKKSIKHQLKEGLGLTRSKYKMPESVAIAYSAAAHTIARNEIANEELNDSMDETTQPLFEAKISTNNSVIEENKLILKELDSIINNKVETDFIPSIFYERSSRKNIKGNEKTPPSFISMHYDKLVGKEGKTRDKFFKEFNKVLKVAATEYADSSRSLRERFIKTRTSEVLLNLIKENSENLNLSQSDLNLLDNNLSKVSKAAKKIDGRIKTIDQVIQDNEKFVSTLKNEFSSLKSERGKIKALSKISGKYNIPIDLVEDLVGEVRNNSNKRNSQKTKTRERFKGRKKEQSKQQGSQGSGQTRQQGTKSSQESQQSQASGKGKTSQTGQEGESRQKGQEGQEGQTEQGDASKGQTGNRGSVKNTFEEIFPKNSLPEKKHVQERSLPNGSTEYVYEDERIGRNGKPYIKYISYKVDPDGSVQRMDTLSGLKYENPSDVFEDFNLTDQDKVKFENIVTSYKTTADKVIAIVTRKFKKEDNTDTIEVDFYIHDNNILQHVSSNDPMFFNLKGKEKKSPKTPKPDPKQEGDPGYSLVKQKTLKKILSDIKAMLDDFNSKIAKKSNKKINTRYQKSLIGSNYLAFLSKEYEQIAEFNSDGTVTLKRSDDPGAKGIILKNIPMLDPDLIKRGTVLKAVVNTNANVPMYDPRSLEKEEIDWFTLREQIRANNGTIEGFDGTIYTENDLVPIEVYLDDVQLPAYIHTTSWMTLENIQEEELLNEKAKIKLLREVIVSQQESGVELTVDFRSAGTFILGNEGTIHSKFPNANIVVQRNGTLRSFNSDIKEDDIIPPKDGFIEGVTYMLVPTPSGNLAIPTFKKKLDQVVVNSLNEAVLIYMNKDNANQDFYEYLLQEGYDVKTPKGIKDYFELFAMNRGNEGFDSFKDFLATKSTSESYFSITNDGNIKFGRGKTKPYFLNPNSSQKQYDQEYLRKLRENLTNTWSHTNLDHIKKSEFNIPAISIEGEIINLNQDEDGNSLPYESFVKMNSTTNMDGINIGTESNPKYVFNIQPRISFTIDTEKYGINEVDVNKTKEEIAKEGVEVVDTQSTESTEKQKKLKQKTTTEKENNGAKGGWKNNDTVTLDQVEFLPGNEDLADTFEQSKKDGKRVRVKKINGVREDGMVSAEIIVVTNDGAIDSTVFLKPKQETTANTQDQQQASPTLEQQEQQNQQTQSEEILKEELIKARKADIEQEREETLYTNEQPQNIFLKYNPKGKDKELTEREYKKVNTIIDRGIKKKLTPEKILEKLKKANIRTPYLKTQSTIKWLEERIEGRTNLKAGEDVVEKINDWYNAKIEEFENQYSELGERIKFKPQEREPVDENLSPKDRFKKSKFWDNIPYPAESEIEKIEVYENIRTDSNGIRFRFRYELITKKNGERILVRRTRFNNGELRKVLKPWDLAILPEGLSLDDAVDGMESESYESKTELKRTEINPTYSKAYIEFENYTDVESEETGTTTEQKTTTEEKKAEVPDDIDIDFYNSFSISPIDFKSNIVSKLLSNGFIDNSETDKEWMELRKTPQPLENIPGKGFTEYQYKLRDKILELNEFLKEEYGISSNIIEVNISDTIYIKVNSERDVSLDIKNLYYMPIKPGVEDSISKLHDDLIIDNVSGSQFKQVVHSIAGNFWNKLISEGSSNISNALELYRINIEEKRDVVQKFIDDNNKNVEQKAFDIVDHYNSYLNNWDKVDLAVRRFLSQRLGEDIVSKDTITQELTKEEKQRSFSEDSSFTISTQQSLSLRLRLLLSFIPDDTKNHYLDPKGKSRNIFRRYHDFNTVFNTVEALLASSNDNYIEPTMESFMQRLQEFSDSFTFIEPLIEVLKKSDTQMQKDFIRKMSNHHIPMVFNRFSSSDGSNNIDTIEILSANQSNIQKQVIEKWKANFLSKTLFKQEDNKYILDPEKVQPIIDKIAAATPENAVEVIPEALRELGIDISDKLVAKIAKGEIKTLGGFRKWEQLVNKNKPVNKANKNDIRKVIIRSLEYALKNKVDVYENNIVTSEGFYNILAKNEAEFGENNFSNSHRTGNKIVASFAPMRNFVQRFLELKFNRNNLRDKLKNLSFNKHSYWLEVLNDSEFSDIFKYFYVSLESIKKYGESRQANGLNEGSDSDFERAMFGFFQNQGLSKNIYGDVRIGRVPYLTMSDKKNVFLLTIPLVDYDHRNGTITLKTPEGDVRYDVYDFFIEKMFKPEAERILNHQDRYHADEINIDGYNPTLFYFIPELNEVSDLFESTSINGNTVRKLKSDVIDPDTGSINPKYKDVIANEIKLSLQNEYDATSEFWAKNNIAQYDKKTKKLSYVDKKYHNYLKGQVDPNAENYGEQLEDAAIHDYNINRIFANSQFYMTFAGDPSVYYKSKPKKSFISQIFDTFDNAGKRLAMDNGPREIVNHVKKYINYLFLNDPVVVSESIRYITSVMDGKEVTEEELEAFEKMSSLEKKTWVSQNYPNSYSYFFIEGADAQEFSTMSHYIDFLYANGEISDKSRDHFLKKMSEETDPHFTKKELNVLFKPIKPLYSGNIIDDAIDVERRLYIKTSVVPLVPQLTKNFQIDNLRVAMEENKIDRAVYKTGAKLGATKYKASIFEGKEIKGIDNIDIVTKIGDIDTRNVLSVPSEYLGKQQETPTKSDKKTERKDLSQPRKLKFVNFGAIKFNFKGKKTKGSVLRKQYNTLYKRLYEIEEIKLRNEIIKPDGSIDVDALVDVIQKEQLARGYSINERAAIDTKEVINEDDQKIVRFKLPLWTVPQAFKLEALMNSIIENKITNLKRTGVSSVLMSEEGFRSKTIEIGDVKDLQKELSRRDVKLNQVVFTPSFKESLKGLRKENGSIKPSQLFLPWRYKENLKDFVVKNKDGLLFLDTEKMPEELLRGIGYRVPNHGHNTMVPFEIAGFLPSEMGDIVIASRDLVVQMGSDFDVDKLYQQLYNIAYDEESGKFDRIENIGYDKLAKDNKGVDDFLTNIFKAKEGIEFNEYYFDSGKLDYERATVHNDILDIELTVLLEDNPSVQRQILKPLSFGKFDQLKNDDLFLRLNEKLLSNPLGPNYQRFKYMSGTSGKTGIGSFSLDLVFNGIIQDYNITQSFELPTILIDGIFSQTNYSIPYTTKTLHYLKQFAPKQVLDSTEYKQGGVNSRPFVNWVNNLDPSTIKNIDLSKVRYKSDVIVSYQTSSVDNEKERILEKFNIVPQMYNLIRTLIFQGFEEDAISYITTQPAFLKYVEYSNIFNSATENYTQSEIQNLAYEKVLNEYLELLKSDELSPDFTIKNFKNIIEKHINNEELTQDEVVTQIALLRNFYNPNTVFPYTHLDGVGRILRKIQTALNLDAAGLGSSIYEASMHFSEIGEILRTYAQATETSPPKLMNLEEIFDPLNTTNGSAISSSISLYRDIFGNPSNPIYPYESPMFIGLLDAIYNNNNMAKSWDSLSKSEKQEEAKRLITNLKSFFVSKTLAELDDRTNSEILKDLFFDVYERNDKNRLELKHRSLALIVSNIQSGTFLKNKNLSEDVRINLKNLRENAFIKILRAELGAGKVPSVLKTNAFTSDSIDESPILYALIDLYKNNLDLGEINGKPYSSRDLFYDLVKAAYASGGSQQATQYAKYLSPNLLVDLGIITDTFDDVLYKKDAKAHSEYFKEINRGSDIYKSVTFIEQYLQNNPNIIRHAMSYSFDDPKVDGELGDPSLGTISEAYDNEGKKLDQKKADISKIDHFKPGRGALKLKIKVDKDTVKAMPPLYIRIGDGPNLRLYRYSEDSGFYHSIDRLSSKFFNHYDANADANQTLSSVVPLLAVSNNKVIPSTGVKTIDPKSYTGKDNTPKETQKSPKGKEFEDYVNSLKNVKDHKELLQLVIDYEGVGAASVEQKELAKKMLLAYENYPIPVTYLNNDKARKFLDEEYQYGAAGSSAIVFSNILFNDAIKGTLREGVTINAVVLHEVIHNLSIAAINAYLNKRPDGQPLSNAELAFKEAMTDEQFKILDRLDILYKQLKKEYEIYDTSHLDNNTKYYLDNIFKNFGEFVAASIEGNEKSINELEKINKRLLNRIKTVIIRLINSFLPEGMKIRTKVINEFYELLDSYKRMGIESKEDITNLPEGFSNKGSYNLEHRFANSLYDIYFNIDENNQIEVTDIVDKKLGIIVEGSSFNKIKKDFIDNPDQKESDSSSTNPLSKKYELFPGVYANEEQREAIDGLTEFINNNDSEVISLVGRGGTGKTTIIKKVTENYKNSILYIAPTHKAKNVLSNSVNSEANTLASALGIKLDETTGEFKTDYWARKMGIPIQGATLVIIDEGSMMSDDLFDQVMKLKRNNAKVILMGDNVQLPPVGQESDSKMFDIEHFKLTKRMRQGENSPIVPLSDIVAKNVESNNIVLEALSDKDKVSEFDSEKNEGVLFLKDEAKMLEEFVKDFKENPLSTRIITYNNNLEKNARKPQSVYSLNKKIRKLLQPNNLDTYVVGDQITGYASTLTGGETTNDNDVMNSSEYTIIEVSEPKQHTITISKNSKKVGTITEQITFEGQEVVLKDNITGRILQPIRPHILPTPNGKKTIQEVKNKYAKKEIWPIFYGIQEIIPEVDFSYAITSHKSQGSTYRNVYVAYDNILRIKGPSLKAKNQSLYVAISRASHKLVMQSTSNPEQSSQSSSKPKGTINVYWGQPESETSTKLLSNLAPRRFTWEGREYGSVEHAYQSNKSGTFDQETYDKYNNIGGYGKKIRGKGTVEEMKAADSLGLMKKLVVESFKQNPDSEAAKKLLQYENFTHNTNELIDQAFLEGLKLAQKELLQDNNVVQKKNKSLKELEEPLDNNPKHKLFDENDKALKKGSVVKYNDKLYLFWNENDTGRAQLINTDGTKFSGTPNVNKLIVKGSYPTVIYNNTEYIVTDNDNIYSGATGKLVYEGNDESSKAQKQKILDKAQKDKGGDTIDVSTLFGNSFPIIPGDAIGEVLENAFPINMTETSIPEMEVLPSARLKQEAEDGTIVFAELVDMLNEQLKSTQKRASEVRSNFENETDPQKQRVLKRRLNDIENREERIKQNLYIAYQAIDVDNLSALSVRHDTELSYLLNTKRYTKEGLTPGEIIYASELIDSWNQYLDWENGTLFPKEIRESDIVQNVFKDFKNNLNNYYQAINKIKKDFLVDNVIRETNLKEEEITKAVEDAGKWGWGAFFDAGRSKSPVLNVITKQLYKTYNKFQLEASRRHKKVDDLIDKALPELKRLKSQNGYSHIYEAFFQLTETEDGEKFTAKMIYPWSQKFFDEIKKERRKLNKQKIKAKEIEDVDRRNNILSKAIKEFSDWNRKNMTIIDPRYLFKDTSIIYPDSNTSKGGVFNPTDSEINDYYDRLVDELGENEVKRQIENLERKLDRYITSFELFQEEQDVLFQMGEITEEEMNNNIREFELSNSPYIHAWAMSENMTNSLLHNGSYIYTSDKYSLSSPKRYVKNSKGETIETDFYDRKMDDVYGNEDLLNLYNEFISIKSLVNSILPEYKKSGVQINDIPLIKKSFIDELFSSGFQQGFFAIPKRMIKSLYDSDEVDTSASSHGRNVKLNFGHNNRNKINAIVKERLNQFIIQKRQEGISLDNAEIQKVRNKIRTEVSDELFRKEYNKDLGVALKHELNLALSYQHRQRVSDLMSVFEMAYSSDEIGLSKSPYVEQGGKKRTVGSIEKEKLKRQDTNIELLSRALDLFEGRKITKKRVKLHQKVDPEYQIKIDEAQKQYQEAKELHENGYLSDDQLNEYKQRVDELKEESRTRTLYLDTFGDLLIQLTQNIGLGFNLKSFFTNRLYGYFANTRAASDGRSFSLPTFYKVSKMLNSRTTHGVEVGLTLAGGVIGAVMLPIPVLGAVPIIGGLLVAGSGVILGGAAGNVAGKGIRAVYNALSPNDFAEKAVNIMNTWDFLKKSQDEFNKSNSKNISNRNSYSKYANQYVAVNSSEWLNQAEVALSILYDTKFIDNEGNEVSLYEALTKEGSFNYEKYGNSIYDPIKKKDVTPEEFIEDIKLMIDTEIIRIHGNYDQTKPIAIKENVLGRMGIQFKSWLPESMASSWEDSKNDYMLRDNLNNEVYQDRKGRVRSLHDVSPGIATGVVSGLSSGALAGSVASIVAAGLGFYLPLLPLIISGVGMTTGIGISAYKGMVRKRKGIVAKNPITFAQFMGRFMRKFTTLSGKNVTQFEDFGLSPEDAANLRAAQTEMLTYTALLAIQSLIFLLIKGLKDDKDDDDYDDMLKVLRTLFNVLSNASDESENIAVPLKTGANLNNGVFPSLRTLDNLGKFFYYKTLEILGDEKAFYQQDAKYGKDGDPKSRKYLEKSTPYAAGIMSAHRSGDRVYKEYVKENED